MNEHHVEKAFREHAVKRNCTKFESLRKDRPDMDFWTKFETGQEDLKVEGKYTWCKRNFHFFGFLHTDGLVGCVCVHAFTHRVVRVDTLPSICALAARFTGFGLNVSPPSIPGRENDGYFFWGINVRIGDMDFTDDKVNMITVHLDAALTQFEEQAAGKNDGS